jgi:hypothetical protein
MDKRFTNRFTKRTDKRFTNIVAIKLYYKAMLEDVLGVLGEFKNEKQTTRKRFN